MGRVKPLERRHQAVRFGGKAPERTSRFERVNRLPLRKKALKGEAPECRELKEASTDWKS
jgi:hypothetical protein